VWEVDGEGDCYGSGASANVGDLQGLGGIVGGEKLQDGFDQVLGFWARDEDVGGDLQEEAVELLLAGDVLDGLVLQAAGDEGVVVGLVLGGEFAVGMREEGDARELQGVEEEEFGVAGGGGVEVFISGELSCCGGEGFAKGGH
jgi:hypothetical protein